MPLTVRPPAPHRTKQEFVYRTLRRAIMSCELGPGERLVILQGAVATASA